MVLHRELGVEIPPPFLPDSSNAGDLAKTKGKRAASIYPTSEALVVALRHAGEEIQQQETAKNLGDVLGRRLKSLESEHAGGDKVAQEARQAKLTDLKKQREVMDEQRKDELRKQITEEVAVAPAKANDKERVEKRVGQQHVREAQEADMQHAKELRFEEAQVAYVEAYRKYDKKFTSNKPDDLIAVTRPPLLAFWGAAKELKRLYGVMVKARESAASEDDNKKIQKNLAGKVVKFKDSEVGLKPKAAEVLGWANEAEERAAAIKRGKIDAEVDKM